MAAIRTTANMILNEILMLHHRPLSSSCSSLSLSSIQTRLPGFRGSTTLRFTHHRGINFGGIRCAASDSGSDDKVSARFSQVKQLLREAEERASSAGNEPIPKITLDHVTVSFARSGGPGGQNVNKVNTKVDMRFNVQNAYWLSDRVRQRIMQMQIVNTPYFFRGNIEDALGKLQAIIDAASYVPPPPSEEKKKKMTKLLYFKFAHAFRLCTLAAIGEQKRLKSKKAVSEKKAFRRSRDSWDK
ncbi:RF PROK I domain-containing protein [Citrus sinensis]|uniref:RF PROK I domain-containing protein n=1 Tax=Citrus sinensis TaxID=2711 RepID=A0ACB8LVR1_CITSI|nr:RF PROK I domain-containing protein [Citrus sinensis]